MGNLYPSPPPKSRMGKWGVLAFARLHPSFGGNGGLLFHFILSKIAASSREDVSPWLSDRFLLCHRGGA